MSYQNYKKQVNLLLSVLPIVALEDCFALHGGTAINLFVRNMPRLSVDIDLTYLPIQDRDSVLAAIDTSFLRIKQTIENRLPDTTVIHKQKEAKLLVSNNNATIKIEVNLIKRGCFNTPITMQLCESAQQEFGVFCEIKVVDEAHLFGGKICAALDRQHPRDLFDVKYLLQTNGFTDELKKGFLFYLISSNRPIVEMLFPHLSDQKLALENQFIGMTNVPFNYKEFEQARLELIDRIHTMLTQSDKVFLCDLENGVLNSDLYDFSSFPAVQWKLLNIVKLKKQNPEKHAKLLNLLKKNFEI